MLVVYGMECEVGVSLHKFCCSQRWSLQHSRFPSSVIRWHSGTLSFCASSMYCLHTSKLCKVIRSLELVLRRGLFSAQGFSSMPPGGDWGSDRAMEVKLAQHLLTTFCNCKLFLQHCFLLCIFSCPLGTKYVVIVSFHGHLPVVSS